MTLVPQVIQGGMGVAVSDWRLAGAVSRLGGLGVVSGTALSVVLSRRLQRGDPGGHVRRALAAFPCPSRVARILARHFVPGGLPTGAPFRPIPMPSTHATEILDELFVAAGFVEVFLAKEGHAGPIGINLLEKTQLATLPTLYGALLAGVDVVLMGAGIPRQIPGILDRLAHGERAELALDVAGAQPEDAFRLAFDPSTFLGAPAPTLRRPAFLAIVASEPLARALARKSTGRVDGFVVEGRTAGGHNAPPRGPLHLSSGGEPLYGERDVADLAGLRALGLPFWLAGSYGRPGMLSAALGEGARGIQVGTAFAFCDESGIAPSIKRAVIERSRAGLARVFTDPVASPTGLPFKVVDVAGSLSDAGVAASRERVCDLGFLRRPHRKTDGGVGYRCPAEPAADYLRKGGTLADTRGRLCVCNGLAATAGLAQIRAGGHHEPALVTAGEDVADVARFCPPGRDGYAAADVMRYLVCGEPLTAPPPPLPSAARMARSGAEGSKWGIPSQTTRPSRPST